MLEKHRVLFSQSHSINLIPGAILSWNYFTSIHRQLCECLAMRPGFCDMVCHAAFASRAFVVNAILALLLFKLSDYRILRWYNGRNFKIAKLERASRAFIRVSNQLQVSKVALREFGTPLKHLVSISVNGHCKTYDNRRFPKIWEVEWAFAIAPSI